MSSAGMAWQTNVWNQISATYLREIDARFAPVIDYAIKRAELRAGDDVLDLGTGTGSAALAAAGVVGTAGSVLGTDIAPEMLELARARAGSLGVDNVRFAEGGAEAIPAEDQSFDAIVATLSMMYVIDRGRAVHECTRVLRPGGRLVAAVWAGPEDADIVRFQATAGRFAPPPPVQGVGPGALADPSEFLRLLAAAGIEATVEEETIVFEFPTFDAAWDVLAGVTTANLEEERRAEAKAAVRELMWPDPAEPRVFSNLTRFIAGRKLGRKR